MTILPVEIIYFVILFHRHILFIFKTSKNVLTCTKASVVMGDRRLLCIPVVNITFNFVCGAKQFSLALNLQKSLDLSLMFFIDRAIKRMLKRSIRLVVKTIETFLVGSVS